MFVPITIWNYFIFEHFGWLVVWCDVKVNISLLSGRCNHKVDLNKAAQFKIKAQPAKILLQLISQVHYFINKIHSVHPFFLCVKIYTIFEVNQFTFLFFWYMYITSIVFYVLFFVKFYYFIK